MIRRKPCLGFDAAPMFMGLVYEGPQLRAGPRAMPVFLLLVLTTAETAAVGHAVYAGRAILEDGPFVEIPTYCASLCLIFIWHSEVSQKVMSESYPFIFFYLFFLHWPILLNFLNIFGLLTLRCEHRRKKKKKIKELGSILHQSAICRRDL